ncbi:hypothetical protein L7F22_012879 [Adiantum nelumboides]|nr:hypothetical protein [Adiantum nelumboides]
MEHPLSLFENYPNTTGTFVCNLCWEPGCGPVYLCLHCNVNIHAACAASTKQQTHFSHPLHPLLLHHVGNFFRRCGSCSLPIKSWCFACISCNIYIHSLCVKAPRFVVHHSHPHPLQIFNTSASNSHRCNACTKPLKDQVYLCTSCEYGLHQFCATLSLHIYKHPKHPNHILRLSCRPLNGKSFVCSGCNEEQKGWQFHCKICDYSIDAECAKFFHEIEHRNHVAGNAVASSDILAISKDDVSAVERVLQFAREKIEGTSSSVAQDN